MTDGSGARDVAGARRSARAPRAARPTSPWRAFVVFVLLDVVCVGGGMGVPFFCILLGIPTGWYAVRLAAAFEFATAAGAAPSHVPLARLRRIWRYALATAAVTFAMMAALWGTFGVAALTNPATDYARTGIPLILFEPKASLLGWLALMIVISPVLQLLTTVGAAHVALLLGTGRAAPAAGAARG